MGYAHIEQKGTGLHLRTFSRAFIIDDGEERFVFVSVDSAMIGHGVRQAVRLQKINYSQPRGHGDIERFWGALKKSFGLWWQYFCPS